MEILQCLAQLVGVIFCSPTGITTGSYQHILSEWLTGSRSEPPPFLYFTEVKLQAWCRLASVMEDALHMVRKQMKVYISDLQRNVSGRIIGQFMFDTMPMVKVQTNHEVAEALTEALLELAKETNDRPLEVISVFLLKKCSKNKELLPGSNADETLSAFLKQEDTNEGVIAPDNAAVCQTHSESRFQQLTFLLLTELAERLQEWGPAQCLGDVFMKFGSRLKTYTNFFNNYTVILKTIDKCREAMPIFRAFLKRHDQTVLTKMMSLQELLLSPSTRFEEYVNLLYALRLHTPPEHSDRKDLNAAIGQMKQYKDYIGQLKASLEKETELTNIQKTIQGCPNLIEANRHLAHVQDVLLLSCANEDISASLRIYEHISDLSLFLFNDALVISSRHISYMPFKRTSKTSYQFMASVSLPRLLVEAIPDTKYVKNAFALQGPKRQWICSTITEEERFTWLSASQSAIHASIEKK